MKFTQVKNEHILQDSPGVLRFMGFFFVAVGVIAFVMLFKEYGSSDLLTYEFLGGFVISLFAFIIGLLMVLTPGSQVIISAKHRYLTVFRRNLFKRSKTLISFQKIKQFIVTEEFNVDGDPKWKVDLELRSGEIVELTKVWNDRDGQCVETAKQANQLLHQN